MEQKYPKRSVMNLIKSWLRRHQTLYMTIFGIALSLLITWVTIYYMK